MVKQKINGFSAQFRKDYNKVLKKKQLVGEDLINALRELYDDKTIFLEMRAEIKKKKALYELKKEEQKAFDEYIDKTYPRELTNSYEEEFIYKNVKHKFRVGQFIFAILDEKVKIVCIKELTPTGYMVSERSEMRDIQRIFYKDVIGHWTEWEKANKMRALTKI